jgi:hypothetical protein
MDHAGDELAQRLPLLLQKNLSNAVRTDKAVYCDVHDLLAFINAASDDVAVYRAINGQVAFTAKHPEQYGEAKPSLLSWKPDGSVLGVGWDDGSCCLYSGEDGKLVSKTSTLRTEGDADWQLDLNPHLRFSEEETTDAELSPTCIAWTAHQSRANAPNSHSDLAQMQNGELSTEDWFNEDLKLNHEGKEKRLKDGLNGLVDSITTLDITKVLPSLSALPSHGLRGGPEAAKFATQSGIDNAFSTSKSTSSSIDTLLVCGPSRYSSVFLDDSVKVGDLGLDLKNALHASHPQCASQTLLSQSDPSKAELHYVDLPLDTFGGSLLHAVAANTKRMQNLTAYITHAVRCIQHDFATGLSLPTRIINGLSEELREKEEGAPTTALFELCMTGKFTSILTEWLTDVIKDTQRKRWEQSVNDMYDHVQNHIFMHLLPALDRLSIAAATLRGHARLHEGTSTFDVPPELFSEMDDCVDAVRLVAERAQLIAMTELREFKAFIRWLRIMIDVATAGPGSKTAIENEQREVPNVDFSLVGAYINRTMRKSGLSELIEQRPDMKGGLSRVQFFDHATIMQLKRQGTSAAIQTLKPSDGRPEAKREGHDAMASINLSALTARLVAQVRLCLDGITSWQQRVLSQQIGTDGGLAVGVKAPVLDMKTFPQSTDGGGLESLTQILLNASSETSGLQLRLLEVTRDEHKQSRISHVDLSFDEATVLHAQIFDQFTYFALLQLGQDSGIGSQYLLMACARPFSANASNKKWNKRVLHNFSDENAAFRPKRFLIGGRKCKKVLVVFSDDDRSWRVLDLEGGGMTGSRAESSGRDGIFEDDMAS